MAKVHVTITVDEKVLGLIDERAASRGVTRSAWVAKAAEYLLSQASAELTYVDETKTTTERTTRRTVKL